MGVSASAPKGYLIAFIKVKDKEKFGAFGAAAKTAIEEYGGTILAKGPGDLVETANGGAEGSAAILLEFASIAQAKEFYYYSESYQKAKEIRDDGGADVSVMFVEGTPPTFTGLMM
ncbi:DUF1330-containing protein [Aureococcus anophagefferens]|nr:DUF1330-containing protein [Aureococcus anophagefferens]